MTVTEATLRALVSIWHHLPELFGPRWPGLFRQLEPQLRTLARCDASDPSQDDAVGEIIRLFLNHAEAKERLRSARDALQFDPETRTTEPNGSPVQGLAWQDIQKATGALVDPQPIHRTVHGTAPRRLPAKRESTISLTIEEGRDGAPSLPLLPDRPLVLQLWRLGGDIEIENPVETISYFEAGDRHDIVFRILGKRLGLAHLSVELFQDEQHIAHLPVDFRVVASGEQEERQNLSPTRLRVSGPYEPGADIELHVRTVYGEGGERPSLGYQLRTRRGVDFEPVGSIPLATSDSRKIEREIDRTLMRLGEESRRRSENSLAELGHWIYQHITTVELHDALGRLDPDLRQLHIVSDEPWIPWELVKPFDPAADWQMDFLAARFELTRWLTAQGPLLPVARRLDLAAWVCLDSRSDDGGTADRSYLDEWSTAERFEEVCLEERSPDAILDLLASGRGDLWHFAIRGSSEDPGDVVVPLALSDLAALEQTHLYGLGPMENHRPLVFMNAHHAARQHQILGKMTGWPATWIQQARCAALVAPRWRVSDRSASRFSQFFYDSLRSGKTFGGASSDARRQLRALDAGATWLSYVSYGHCNARSSNHLPG